MNVIISVILAVRLMQQRVTIQARWYKPLARIAWRAAV